MLERLHTKKIYIDFLEYVLKNQQREQNRWMNTYPLVLRDFLKRDFGYSESALDKARAALIKADYLGVSTHSHKLYVTDAGKNYLKEYGEFLLLLMTQKVAVILKKNVQTAVAVTLSVLTVIFLIHKHV